MNKDEISGKMAQVAGKLKQGVGEALGNQKVANQGIVDQAKGAAKETWANARDAADQVRESHKEAAEEKADNVRHRISQSRRCQGESESEDRRIQEASLHVSGHSKDAARRWGFIVAARCF
jgi:uncharacterized protein YjbJ (UPF0337 family)